MNGQPRLDAQASDAGGRVVRHIETPPRLLGQGGVNEDELGTNPFEDVASKAIGGRSHALSIPAADGRRTTERGIKRGATRDSSSIEHSPDRENIRS